MTRIEMVLELENVELFRFCSAHEMVRIAGIAKERRYGAGEVLYQESEAADALFCVLAGEVELRASGRPSRRFGRHQALGVREILSGRLRRYTARALEPTTVLALDAEDFFDLLSNNIEIVRALFREMLGENHDGESEEPGAEEDREHEGETAAVERAALAPPIEDAV